VNSTAKAAQEAAKDSEGLAICSLKCAEVYDLDVVDTDIQDAGYCEYTLSNSSNPLADLSIDLLSEYNSVHLPFSISNTATG